MLEIKKIILCSDQHVRLFKRHTEYQQVFTRFFKYVDSIKDENTVICLGGDLVHNKIEMTPELIHVVSNFLKECADRLPTIIFLGNHDYISNNANRLDAITPIVEALNHPNLHFWKDSGVYKLGGISFSLFSLLGSTEDWVPANKIKAKTKVALFHGPVMSHLYSNPFIEEGTRTVNIDKFSGFDIVLLGDIHIPNNTVQEYKLIDGEKYPAAKYPGSLICQGFGEPATGHGILVWDVATKQSEFVEIENDFCYYTLEIINNRYTIPKKLPKKVRLRIKREGSTIDTVNQAIAEFSKKYTIVELIKQKDTATKTSQTTNTTLGNSRDVNYQNLIIEEYLKEHGVDAATIEEIKLLNIENNKLLPQINAFRDITWLPKTLEFSNMFSYGENNVIDFSNFNGVYGITGANTLGKSNILDILTFAIYDKATRASKAIHILNNTKQSFRCKFSFEYNGHEYFIERVGTKNERTNAVRVDVSFWMIDDDGNEKVLNGEDRDQTNKLIREYLGTYDDFVMTALSTQYVNQSFVEKSQRERKDLLYKFLDISIYDDLFRFAKDTGKEQQTLIKDLEKADLHGKSSSIYASMKANEERLKVLTEQDEEVKLQLKTVNLQINDLNKQLQFTDNSTNINDVENKIASNISELTTIATELKGLDVKLSDLKAKFKTININVEDEEAFLADKTIEKCIEIETKKQNSIQTRLNKTDSEIKSINKKQEHLSNHKYDPNCEFCCDNSFVKDAIESINQLPSLQETFIALKSELLECTNILNHFQQQTIERNAIISAINERNSLQNSITLTDERIKSLKYKGSTLREKTKQLEKQKETYYENEQRLLSNQKIENEILNLKSELSKLEKVNDKILSETKTVFGNLSSFTKEYDLLQGKITTYNELIKSNRIHELYTQALNRDGVPYLILEKILPVIENEVNEVLQQVVSFQVKLESTEEKYIHAFIDYGENKTWPVELTSGMERFILSLAFRTSLTEITALPRPPFLAIDEGFGVLDSDNLMAMGKMFEFLKTRYNYLLIISHIEAMRDLVDKRITVFKQNDYSTVTIED